MDLAESAVLAFSVPRCGGACKWRHHPDPARPERAQHHHQQSMLLTKCGMPPIECARALPRGRRTTGRSGLLGQVTRLSLASGRPLAAVLQPSLPRFASVRSPAGSLLINWMKTWPKRTGYEVPPPSAGPWKRPGGCPLSEGAPRRLSVDASKELRLVRHSAASWQQK